MAKDNLNFFIMVFEKGCIFRQNIRKLHNVEPQIIQSMFLWKMCRT